MAYKKGDRFQMTLLPASVEDYVFSEDPVRAYDAIITHFDRVSILITLVHPRIWCVFFFQT